MKTPHGSIARTASVILGLASLIISSIQCVPALTPARANHPSRSAALRTTVPIDDAANKLRISEAYGKLPMSFEPNRGQTDKRVEFLSRGAGYNLFLTQTEATLALYKNKEESDSTSRGHHSTLSSIVRMKFKGANTKARIEGLDQLPGKSNYLIGNDRAKWHTDIPTFAQVQYTDVYPGIDVVYYGQQRQLEYDFRLAAGADPSKIRIAFDGAQNLSIDAEGNLVLKTNSGEIIQHPPVIYQENESGRQSIAGCYVLRGKHEIGFEVSAYDRSKPLVIDPQLVYSTYLGGGDTDVANGIAVDSGGNAYISGETTSVNFPVTSVVDATANPNTTTAFVTKLNAAGTGTVYSTIIGNGSGFILGNGFVGTQANAIAVTSDGKAYITGNTDNSSNDGDFPVTSNAYQKNGFCHLVCTFIPDRVTDAFVTVLNPQGNGLFYSTFFGGGALEAGDSNRGSDTGESIAVDSASRVYITGLTASNNLPTKNAFQNSRQSSGEGTDAFIAVFNPALANGNDTLLYSSFLGGSGDDIGKGIAVDSARNAYVVGSTASSDLDTKAPAGQALPPLRAFFQGGPTDAFVAKIDTEVSGASSLTYLTYFGGSGTDRAEAVAVDSAQRAYVTGASNSSPATFPLLNAFDSTQTNGEAFIAKLNADGTALFYSSFLGGNNGNTSSDGEEGLGIAVDSAANAYVTGRTTSGASFPLGAVAPPFPANLQGTAFVAKIEASLSNSTTPKLLYSTTFGGNGTSAKAVALDPKGNVYLAGSTTGSLPTTTGAFQPAFNGGSTDGFVAKISSTFNDTIGIYRPSTGEWGLRNSNSAGLSNFSLRFGGQSRDQPLAGDWNGDGIDDVGVFRSTGQFLLRQDSTTTITINFGVRSDLAVVGDWDGDGIDTPGVFRPATGQWFLTNSKNVNNSSPAADVPVFTFGAAGDLPLAGDWDGDGIDTIGVFRPSINTFLLRNSNTGGAPDISFQFGIAEDLPLAGDWNGDGVDTIGVLRPSVNTFFLSNVNAFDPANTFFFNFGQAGDLPVAGDWNGRPDPFTPPNSGVNDPSSGSNSVGQPQLFVTTCSDPDGWHDIATIDFKIAKSDGNGNGVPITLWVQFNENTNRIRFYDPDSQTWSEGEPGSDVVLSSRFAELHLDNTSVLGSGPTGSSVQIMWSIVFKDAAIMNNYKQYLKITDDAGLTTGFDKVGSWSVIR
jgi:hypothetical protein